MTGGDLGDLAGAAMRAGRDAGLDAVGIASAVPFVETRHDLEERKRNGIHAGMAFTYRNPARSTDPAASLAGAHSLVVGALSYRRSVPPPSDAGREGFVARYSWTDHYALLREALEASAGVLREAGYAARCLADDNALVDRAAAYRAGLGWWGKNSNLLLPGGSWFVLGSVVTDAPLPTSPREVTDGCGTCSRCMDECPTGAIVAPGVVDARRCLAWLLQAPGTFPEEFRVALGGRIYGCDDCQEVCPPNRVVERRYPPDGASDRDQAWVDLVELLALDDDELLARYGRWYIAQRDPRFVRRNALVALGNIAMPDDAGVQATLRLFAEGEDGLLAEHALWALQRIRARGSSAVVRS